MERHVKERLVGATILVVLIVLIVPELLSGPKRAAGTAQPSPAGPTETIRSVTVDLATNQTTASIDETAAAAASSAAASSAAPAAHDGAPDGDRTPGATSGAPPNAPSSQAPAPAAAMLETGSSFPKSEARGSVLAETHGVHAGWAAQLGSFAARANAEKLDRELRAQGFAASLSASGVGLAARYRVRVGPTGDRASAERLVAKLKKAGHPASVVPSG